MTKRKLSRRNNRKDRYLVYVDANNWFTTPSKKEAQKQNNFYKKIGKEPKMIALSEFV